MGPSFNIFCENGMTYCFQPEGGLCPGDVYLTQKLALETRETEAIRVSNRGYVSDGITLECNRCPPRRQRVAIAGTTAKPRSPLNPLGWLPWS